jgi:RNA-directed DNA polymerase
VKDVEERHKARQTDVSGAVDDPLGKPETALGIPKYRPKAGAWTPRMLKALERGVKGGKWFSLWDKVHTRRNLDAAWIQVKSNKGAAGVDRMTLDKFKRHWDSQMDRLSERLRLSQYSPQPIRRVMIPKPGSNEKRPLGIPTVRDRIVQTALLNVLEPIFEHSFSAHSYGFRPGRGCKDALRRVQQLLRSAYTYVVDADIKGYFDNIPHEALMQRVEEHVADGRVLDVLRKYLKADILDAMNTWTPQQGTPQGAVISPLLANIYLNPLDHLMAEHGYEMTRYADDFIIQCKTRQQAEEALVIVKRWMENNGLTLHPEKTRIADAAKKGEGFDFLGYHFECGKQWPRKKSEKRFREAIKAKTRRNNGNNMLAIIGEINPMLRGWFGYYKHSLANTMTSMDGYVRGRLRSIMRKRQKKKGRARGDDHHRWPNAYFHALGLLSLAAARDQTLQSSRR